MRNIIFFITIITIAASSLLFHNIGSKAYADESEKKADGQELFEARCAACHATSKPLKKKYDSTRWTGVIDRMSGYMKNRGFAALTPEEKKLIAEYLGGR